MLNAHRSAVVAVILLFQAAELWVTLVIRFFVNVEFIYSIFDDEAPFVLPFTTFNHNQWEVLSLRLEFHIPKYLCSFNVSECEQPTNVLYPALTTPRLPNIDIGADAA